MRAGRSGAARFLSHCLHETIGRGERIPNQLIRALSGGEPNHCNPRNFPDDDLPESIAGQRQGHNLWHNLWHSLCSQKWARRADWLAGYWVNPCCIGGCEFELNLVSSSCKARWHSQCIDSASVVRSHHPLYTASEVPQRCLPASKAGFNRAIMQIARGTPRLLNMP